MSHWQDIQKKTFTRWCNEHLKSRGMHIDDLYKDLCNGILLINLIEVISAQSLGRYNRNPRIIQQKLENVSMALKFLQNEGIKLVNIGPEDIVNGQPKLILGLIWTLILRYHIKIGKVEDNSAKNALLEWVRSKIPEYNIQNFTKDWNDGRAICALVNALQPGLCPDHWNLPPNKAIENATRGIELANKPTYVPVVANEATVQLMGVQHFNVPMILAPEDMCNPKVDELSVMTYISYFRDVQPSKPRDFDASRCKAYGPGLVEAVQNEETEFFVEVPKDASPGKLEIKVEGPKNDAKNCKCVNAALQVHLTKDPDGRYHVKYTPNEPGEWKVHVTLDGHHVPGSIFHVVILEAISLGGEGKIRVYYSTTNRSDKARSDVANLQKLLEVKEIHKRPDFEPWIPVDVMDKPDREAVFKKAGTRNLPIVFIDDKYVGDYDTCVELEKTGKLNILLNYRNNPKK